MQRDDEYVVASVRRAFFGAPCRAISIAFDWPVVRLSAFVRRLDDAVRDELDACSAEVVADFSHPECGEPRIELSIVDGEPALFETPWVVVGPIVWSLSGASAKRRESIARDIEVLRVEPPYAGEAATKAFLVDVSARASPSISYEGFSPIVVRHHDLHFAHGSFGWTTAHSQGLQVTELASIAGWALPADPVRAAAVARRILAICTSAAASDQPGESGGKCKYCGIESAALDFDRERGACHICMAARGAVF